MKKYIKQEDPMGCGIACVAYVLGIDYKSTVHLFTEESKRLDRGYTSKNITEALGRGGNKYRSVYIGREKEPEIEVGSIVYVPKCKDFPCGHYLVKIKCGYMDPFINLHESTFDHIKVKAGLRRILQNKISMKIIPVLHP